MIDDRCQMGGIPESKRVQAPAAPGFYRSCAEALTDGFFPQSGLVQRRVLYAACGAPFGGWRHHLPARFAGGTMGAGQWRQFEFMAAKKRKPYNRALPGGKQANRPDGRCKCTPFCRLSATSLHGKASHVIFRSLSLPYKSRSLATPEGEICHPLSFWTHKYLKA